MTVHARWPARFGLARLTTLSVYASLILFVVSVVFAVRVFAVAPSCIFPLSIPSCLPGNTTLLGAVYAGIGGILLLVGCIVFDRRTGRAKETGRTAPLKTMRAATILVIVAVALLLTAAILTFLPPIQRQYRLADADLSSTWPTNFTIERFVTIRAYAGDFLEGNSLVDWYDNRSGRYVGGTGSGGWIVPSGDPLDPGLNDLGNGYWVPHDGAYTVFTLSSPCELVVCIGISPQNYTSLAWINLTGTNPTLVPTVQLGSAIVGAGSYLGALMVTWEGRRPPPGFP